MSYDGIVMRAVSIELNNLLQGARIDKIYQHNKNEVYLVLRQPGCTYKLLISAMAQEAGIYLTSRTMTNPSEPPLFCMLLRKHLEGGKILSFTQHGLERIMEITCEVIDEIGELAPRQIVVEVMGKHSNIILVDPHRNKILDAIHRVTPAVSRYRQVLPGLIYQAPPPQDKIIPWEVDQDAFYGKLLKFPLSQTLTKILLASFSGFGPQSTDEIINRASLSPSLPLEYCGDYELSKLWQAFSQAAVEIKKGDFSPELIIVDQIPRTFSALALTHFPEESRHSFSSINDALDFYFNHKKTADLFKQKTYDLSQIIKKETERCEKKASLQLQTIHESRESEKFRLWGELLTAQLHSLKPGKEAKVINYYDPAGESIIVPLEEHLTIMQNAQRYFGKYQKAKNAAHQAKIHYKETEAELQYLYSLASSLENVTTLNEIEEIREEMKEAAYLKTSSLKASKRKASIQQASLPLKLCIDTWEIQLGKNNKQNDLLVTKIAKSDDIWLHTKDIPGSHVIIRNPAGQKVPNHILEQAALMAAYHSKARFSTNIPVDYTLKKHVWKLKAARPGMVHYENQRTVYVTPDPQKVKNILNNHCLD